MAQRKKTRPRREAGPAANVAGRSVPLRTLTQQALDSYFTALNGHAPGHLSELVLREVAEPPFRAVLDYAAWNQRRCS